MIKDPSEKDEIYLANVAKIGKSTSNIQYLKNVLSEEEHKIILNYAKNSESWNKTPWGSESIKSGDLPKNIFDMLQKVFRIVYEKSKSTYGVDIQPGEKKAIHLVKFDKGFYLEPHEDTLSDESLHIASVYYINDDYTGGEIVFPQHNLTIKPSPNSLIIFPGNENYVHQVIEIRDRPRYSSALWLQFTGSTFNKKREWFD
jgi:Rps23 Pro-64 3,4-dihydroxylase Tpa1-like proline 4-hydroxylase